MHVIRNVTSIYFEGVRGFALRNDAYTMITELIESHCSNSIFEIHCRCYRVCKFLFDGYQGMLVSCSSRRRLIQLVSPECQGSGNKKPPTSWKGYVQALLIHDAKQASYNY